MCNRKYVSEQPFSNKFKSSIIDAFGVSVYFICVHEFYSHQAKITFLLAFINTSQHLKVVKLNTQMTGNISQQEFKAEFKKKRKKAAYASSLVNIAGCFSVALLVLMDHG